jgi:hypothetical protein
MSLPAGATIRVTNAIGTNQFILLSPSCSNAFVYAPGSNNGMLISGLPGMPQIASINLSSTGPIIGAAASDQGSLLLAALDSDGTANVSYVPSSGPPQLVKHLQKFGALAFLSGSETALIADAGANSVLRVTQLGSTPTFATLASAVSGVLRPIAVAASADGHFGFAANGSGGTILRFDLASKSAPVTIPCACTPSEFIPLLGNAIFQLNDPAAGTIYALEGDSAVPRTLFIPTDGVVPANGGAQ